PQLRRPARPGRTHASGLADDGRGGGGNGPAHRRARAARLTHRRAGRPVRRVRARRQARPVAGVRARERLGCVAADRPRHRRPDRRRPAPVAGGAARSLRREHHDGRIDRDLGRHRCRQHARSAGGRLARESLRRGRHLFERPRDVFKFALIAGLSTMVSATIGVTSLELGGYAAWTEGGRIWWTWWLGDVVGALIIAPLIVLWTQPPVFALERRLEAGGVL